MPRFRDTDIMRQVRVDSWVQDILDEQSRNEWREQRAREQNQQNDEGRPRGEYVTDEALTMAQGAQPESILRQQFVDLSLDELADRMAARDGGPGTHVYNSAHAEIIRRQTIAGLASSKAQNDAATAAQRTAEYTRKSAC